MQAKIYHGHISRKLANLNNDFMKTNNFVTFKKTYLISLFNPNNSVAFLLFLVLVLVTRK